MRPGQTNRYKGANVVWIFLGAGQGGALRFRVLGCANALPHANVLGVVC
jgi:hypothetical protein